jgi:hypothetical protein
MSCVAAIGRPRRTLACWLSCIEMQRIGCSRDGHFLINKKNSFARIGTGRICHASWGHPSTSFLADCCFCFLFLGSSLHGLWLSANMTPPFRPLSAVSQVSVLVWRYTNINGERQNPNARFCVMDTLHSHGSLRKCY